MTKVIKANNCEIDSNKVYYLQNNANDYVSIWDIDEMWRKTSKTFAKNRIFFA